MAQRKACSDREAASWIPFIAIVRENVIRRSPQLDRGGNLLRSSRLEPEMVWIFWVGNVEDAVEDGSLCYDIYDD